MQIQCPFCGGDTHQLDWQSICKDCFRRWETEYTDKLSEEYKGEFYGKKTRKQEAET